MGSKVALENSRMIMKYCGVCISTCQYFHFRISTCEGKIVGCTLLRSCFQGWISRYTYPLYVNVMEVHKNSSFRSVRGMNKCA
jgi:hypothetical protein